MCVHQTGGASYQAHRWWHIWVAGQRCVRSASSQARLGTVCVEFHMLAPWLHKPAPDQRLWTFHRHSPIPAHRLPPSFIYIFFCRSHLCFSRFLSVLSRHGAIDRFVLFVQFCNCEGWASRSVSVLALKKLTWWLIFPSTTVVQWGKLNRYRQKQTRSNKVRHAGTRVASLFWFHPPKNYTKI